MPGIYDDMQKIASTLLTSFAQGVISYVRLTPIAGATPDSPAVSTFVASSVKGVVRGVQFKYVMRGLAVETDLQVTIAGDQLTSAPSIRDFIDIGGIRHKIVQIINKPGTGTIVVWTFIVRK